MRNSNKFVIQLVIGCLTFLTIIFFYVSSSIENDKSEGISIMESRLTQLMNSKLKYVKISKVQVDNALSCMDKAFSKQFGLLYKLKMTLHIASLKLVDKPTIDEQKYVATVIENCMESHVL